MSKPIDYSRFDNLDDYSSSSDDDNNTASRQCNNPPPIRQKQQQQQQPLPPPPQQPLTAQKMSVTKKSKEGRYIFEYDGRTIYEWEQSLEEVNMYIPSPPSTPSSEIICNISPTHLHLGLRGAPHPFLSEPTFSKVKPSESSWCVVDGVINITLAKVFKGETWDTVLTGRVGGESVVDPMTREQIRKDLMIERFQEENPGFDFRGAQFNGEAPDPRTFMGGVKYN